MANVIDCNGSAFRNLKNPYTGAVMKVKMVVRPDAEPLFFAPAEYDTASRQPSARSAYDNWNRVDGVFGLKTGSRVTCAYTGQLLSLSSDGESHWLEGGFNPTRLHTRDEFLKFATMRDGRPTAPSPIPSTTRVDKVDEEPPMPTKHEVTCTDAAMDAALELAEKAPAKRGRGGK